MMEEINTQLKLTSKDSMFLSIINNKVKGQVIGPDNIRDVITTETGHLSSVVRDVIDEKVNRDFKIMEEAVELLKFYKQDPNFSCFDFDLCNLEYYGNLNKELASISGVVKTVNTHSKVEIGKPVIKSTELQSMEKEIFDVFKRWQIKIDFNYNKQCTKKITIKYKKPYGIKTYYVDKSPLDLHILSYEQFAKDINSLKFISSFTL